MTSQLQLPTNVLRIALGLTATLAGLDKFFNILVDWTGYVSPLTAELLPVSTGFFMRGVGIIELAVGASILFLAPVIGSYVASAWLLLVAVNLAIGGFFDIAVRDVVLAISAFTLARLLTLQEEASPSGATAPAATPTMAPGHRLI
jgi:hypothetical protein